ncbi:hypothetical protein GF406_01470 [candidate division KSB1 bacterium]|nr:hypothetical protein [candidate division KSB1 bacterium]
MAKTNENLHLVRIDSVQVKGTSGLFGRATLMVYGILPSPAYELFTIETTIQKDEIVLKPLAKHDPEKIVIQITVPFQEKIKVKGLKRKMTYQIKVQGQESTVVEKFKL